MNQNQILPKRMKQLKYHQPIRQLTVQTKTTVIPRSLGNAE